MIWKPRPRPELDSPDELLEVASRFQAAARSFSIIFVLGKEALAQPPPQQDPEVFADHSALPLAVALDAGVNRGAGNTFFLGDAGDGLRSQDFAPGRTLDGIQVDEQAFLLPDFRIRSCWCY